MPSTALFRPTDDGFAATELAVGPWDQRYVHGAAVAALLAGRLHEPDGTVARLTIDILAPVPIGELGLTRSEPTGGRRVRRREATLVADGRTVAVARSVVVRRSQLELPAPAHDHASPFDPAAKPPLDEPNRKAAEMVGWESFDSAAAVLAYERVPGDDRIHEWISLAVPVVDGEPIHGVELAVVAADYAQSAVMRQLPLADWSYRNAELTLHLSREPVGDWVGMRCESLVDDAGCGFNAADIFDAHGRVGRSASALVIEPRQPPGRGSQGRRPPP